MKHGVRPDVVTYNTLLSACERAANVSKAIQLFHNMSACGVVADTISFNSLISCLGKAGEWKKAMQYFDQMTSLKVKQDEITFTSAITACGKGRQWAKALELFGEMDRRGLPCSVISYTATINACERSGRWSEALQMFDLMAKDRRVQPNVVTYTAAISACACGKQWVRALEILNNMQKQATCHANVRPNQITYGMAIRACARCNKWEKAMEVMRAMDQKGIRHGSFSFSEAISACSGGGYHVEAVRLYDRMCTEKIRPNRRAFAGVLTSLDKLKQHHRVQQVVQHIKAMGIDHFNHPVFNLNQPSQQRRRGGYSRHGPSSVGFRNNHRGGNASGDSSRAGSWRRQGATTSNRRYNR
uniref:Pentacotripeptide-repeat region of PRORP domain-containing protein n=1 Tax=Lotharella oceanica TaxID=641309 RepID=A0A7S2XJS3_9EUKA|mmetsp:Transcript_7213/g.14157  ORF Transcript_7213/g.14157 Transcript_7213/m.14157 type:complete len:357 (+) Transcript_7213:3-1073(+)